MRKLVVLLAAAAVFANPVKALPSAMTNETDMFTDKFVTFKDINGGLYQRVQLLSADSDQRRSESQSAICPRNRSVCGRSKWIGKLYL